MIKYCVSPICKVLCFHAQMVLGRIETVGLHVFGLLVVGLSGDFSCETIFEKKIVHLIRWFTLPM